MCGIAGYIGESSNPELSYAIISSLFKNLEMRGKDASGLYGFDNNNNFFYHKEPIKSSSFVEQDYWKAMKNYNPKLLLIHARATSANSGSAKTNKNNHPFVTSDMTIGLVHNGVLHESECLKKLYEIQSNTDSEILLRILESNSNHIDRIAGITKIFNYITKGHMAVAFGEKINEVECNLYLFRNKHRPLCIIDMRELTNQIFFVSSKEIWDAAIGKDYQTYKPCAKYALIELPEDEIWNIYAFRDNLTIEKYKSKMGEFKEQEVENCQQYKVIEGTCKETIVTDLKDDCEVDYQKRYVAPTVSQKWNPSVNCVPYYIPEEEDTPEDRQSNIRSIEEKIDEIKALLDDIQTTATMQLQTGDLANSVFYDLQESLEQTKRDVQATIACLDNRTN